MLSPRKAQWLGVAVVTLTSGLSAFLLFTAGWQDALPWGLLAVFFAYLTIRVRRASKSPRIANDADDAV